MIILTPQIAELNGTLVGTYYIGVLGRASSVFTLNYHTEKVDSTSNDSSVYKTPILLNEKYSAKGVLQGRNDY